MLETQLVAVHISLTKITITITNLTDIKSVIRFLLVSKTFTTKRKLGRTTFPNQKSRGQNISHIVYEGTVLVFLRSSKR